MKNEDQHRARSFLETHGMIKDTEKNLISVYVAADEMEAQHLKHVLSEQGIEAKVVGAGLIGGAGELPPGWSLSPKIWVDAKYEAKARQILTKWEQERRQRRTDNAPDWRCPQCCADVPGGFEICWQCQSSGGDVTHGG